MYEDDLFQPDQVGIFKGVVAELQAINLTASTTWNLIFMCVKNVLALLKSILNMEHLTV